MSEQVEQKPVGETVTQIEAGNKEDEKLSTIQEEGKPEKKPSPVKTILAKVKSLFACVKLAKREKPAKAAEEGDKKTEEGEKAAEENKEEDGAAAPTAGESKPATETAAPTLPPVGAATPVAEDAKN